MTHTLRYLLLFVLIGLSSAAFAQGEIYGRVLDNKKEPLISASVQVYQGGILKGGTVTDFDGLYSIKPLDAGYYQVLVSYTGLDSMRETDVVVTAGLRTSVNFTMEAHSKELKTFVVKESRYKKPLIDVDKPSSHILTKTEIDVLPTTNTSDQVSLAPGVYQSTRNGGVSIGGARGDGTLYIIDGVQVQGSTGTNMAVGSVDQLEVITSGIPANYGDVSGGVVNITSRGVSQKFTGQVRAQHSIDGYNNNLVNFSIAGPVYKKKVKGSPYKKPVLGFALSGDYYDDHDRYPTYNQEYVAKGDVLKNLRENPLKIVTDNSGQPVYNYSSFYIHQSDLVKSKIPPHDEIKEYRLNGKLDYQLTDNMRIVGGGTFDYTSQDAYSRARNLFAPEATPVINTLSGRGYLRFTQKFGKSGDTSQKHNIISNAYYSLQVDYQKLYQSQHDPKFNENLFDYAYIGKFDEARSNVYFPLQTDSASGQKGTILLFTRPEGITYTRYETNPNLANYTTQYYKYNKGNLPLSITQMQASNALANGDEPNFTYGLFYSPGATLAAYTKFNSNQYALDVNASFDLLAGKTKHAIQFGLYYQQRVESSYTVYANEGGTNSIWSLMRGLVSSVNNGNLRFDKQHPIFVVNGVQYKYTADVNNPGHGTYTDPSGNIKNITPGPNDTIFYNYENVGTSTFDKNLRKKLGIGATQDINIDALDRSTYSLNLFSADELLNSGHSYVFYQGYNYLGQMQSTNVNFNDFWTQKDANGNYTRPIGAFRPNYIAGYLLDNFNYKDVHFNIGVRIDRYSANTKVLIDPYSEYAVKTVNQVSGTLNTINGGHHPGNMGSNYVVYVDDNHSTSPNIIGYRSGNTWYDPTGKFIPDPGTLKQYSGGRDPQPAVVNDTVKITSNNFNPNQSFTDYTPQVTMQPRVSFSFPISDVADFYAHYDIYAQRPTSNIDATAVDYYYLQQNSNQIINNANLKPQKTIDYEVGFQQKLSERSALTITAFYKERKDMITVVPYLYAWPTTYYTYGNRDFSTTKGTTLLYDMRATNHLRMNISYTLQFAEGTGSTPNSTNRNGGGQISPNGLLQSFIQAGLPNLRYVTALDYDSRHNIAANIDYRFGDGEGPLVAGRSIFQNAGIDFIARARSGEPYTRYTDALGNTVIGGVAGSRLPWHYGVDVRVDKDFLIANGNKNKNVSQGVKPKRPLYLKAILQVNNLLNTRDVLGVYGYTGRPDDNGYLTSSYGRQFVPQQIDPQSYTDLYKIATNSPGSLNYARTISFALQFNF
jgi:Carboxypeptidase regulatory-like domain/TonB-dependent Receptor Plug Domain